MNDNYKLILEAYENWRVVTCNGSRYPGVLFVDKDGNHWKPWMKALEGQNPINQLMDVINEKPVRKRPDMSQGTLYVAGDLTDELVSLIEKETTVKNIVYYSDQDYANKEMHDHFTFERLSKNLGELNQERKWWTHEFYDNAYEIVKDRKYPICLPCYNRPDVPAILNLGVDKYTDDCYYDWYLFVRETQYDMYNDYWNKEEYKEYRKYIHIIPTIDTEINSAGKVRARIQKWAYDNNYIGIFEIDDDTELVSYLYDGFKENGDPKSEYRAPRVNNKMGNSMEVNSARVFAMWQLAMEEAIKRDDKIAISSGMPISFSWKNEYCQQCESFQLSRGALTQVVCFNIKKLVESDIWHKHNPEVGFDDIDFTIRCLESGLDVCDFPFIIYKCEPMGQGAIVGDLKERFIRNNNKLKENHGSPEKASWIKFREKRDLDQCCIYFPGVRKMQLEKGFWENNEYKFNIYNCGELIK